MTQMREGLHYRQHLVLCGTEPEKCPLYIRQTSKQSALHSIGRITQPTNSQGIGSLHPRAKVSRILSYGDKVGQLVDTAATAHVKRASCRIWFVNFMQM
jgi:hypothetical protein